MTTKITVDIRQDRLFVGDVAAVWMAPGRQRAGPWRLAEDTEAALGISWRGYRLHRCESCAQFFIAYLTAHVCSTACLPRVQRMMNERALREAERPPSKAAQRRASLAAATCQVCGEPIQAKRLTARFCSNRCRQKHHRHRAP